MLLRERTVEKMENIAQVANGVSLILLQGQPLALAAAVGQSELTAAASTSPQPQPILPKPEHPRHSSLTKAAQSVQTSTRTPPLKPAKKLRTEDNEILRCKRRLDFAKLGLHFQRPCPVTVSRRNERERKRVKQINHTFVHLRDHLPQVYWGARNPTKVSKVDTLKAAIDYIHNLQDLIQDHDHSPPPHHTTALHSARPTQHTTALHTAYAPVSAPSTALHTPSAALHATPQCPSSTSMVTSPGASSCASTASSASSETPSSDPPLSPEEEELLDFASWFQ